MQTNPKITSNWKLLFQFSMEKNGYVRSYFQSAENGKRRTYYAITADGRSYYNDKCREWKLTQEVIEHSVKDEAEVFSYGSIFDIITLYETSTIGCYGAQRGMERHFQTHRIRETYEISNDLWDFSTIGRENGEIKMKTAVPSCWETYPETENYRGRAAYERDINTRGNFRLVFKGVGHTCEVYLDDELIAHHYNAYTPFHVVCGGISDGLHRLKVLADNSFSDDSALHVPNDYMSYGGITRPVILEYLKASYIKYAHFTPFYAADGWHARAVINIENLLDAEYSGTCNILMRRFSDSTDHGCEKEIVVEKGVEFHVEAKGVTEVSVEKKFDYVDEWSADSPTLYELVVELVDVQGNVYDDLIDHVGFRTIETQGGKILLNGKPLYIKGFCRHEDHPHFGSSLPYSAMNHDILMMRDLGANAVRTTHYPYDEVFLDLCDEFGILVWEENHARGLSEEQMRNPNFEKQEEACIREMIEVHHNHPSIYIWGILNECASDSEYGRSCYENQFALIRELDESRPVSFASCKFFSDICLDLVDVVSYNIYPLWYNDISPEEYLNDLYGWVQEETKGAGKPFLITEVGAGGIYGCRSPRRAKWTEEYQAEALNAQLTAILKHTGCSGVYIWQFCDNRVSDEWFAGRPRTMNNKGIVDEYRRPKLAYETVRDLFGTRGRENT